MNIPIATREFFIFTNTRGPLKGRTITTLPNMATKKGRGILIRILLSMKKGRRLCMIMVVRIKVTNKKRLLG